MPCILSGVKIGGPLNDIQVRMPCNAHEATRMGMGTLGYSVQAAVDALQQSSLASTCSHYAHVSTTARRPTWSNSAEHSSGFSL